MTQKPQKSCCASCGQPLLLKQPEPVGWSLCEQCSTLAIRKERQRVLAQLRRAHQAGLPATLTLADWLHTLQDFNHLCAYCQQRPFEALEHFIPIDAGGGTTVQNCVPSCGRCNFSKGIANPDSHQLDLFIYETRERVRRYLSGRAPDTRAHWNTLTGFKDLLDLDFFA
jgi:hypothetical protein